jgi:hypothetical protein
VVQLVAIPFLLYNGVLFGLFHTNPWGRILVWLAASSPSGPWWCT